jgi:hypothetical protein
MRTKSRKMKKPGTSESKVSDSDFDKMKKELQVLRDIFGK